MPGESVKWPAPLYRQYLLLAWGAGFFAWRFPAPGLTALALAALFCLWSLHGKLSNHSPGKTHGRLPGAARLTVITALLLMSVFFGLGWTYAQWRAPEKGAVPEWTAEASTPSEDNQLYKQGLRLRGTVREVTGQTDGRLRLIIDDLRPVAAPGLSALPALPDDADFANAPAERLPGGLVFTWYAPSTPEGRRLERLPAGFGQPDSRGQTAGSGQPYQSGQTVRPSGPVFASRPVPGQVIEGTFKIRRVHTLMNPGLWEQESYWADRGVWHRAWGSGNKPELEYGPVAAASGLADFQIRSGLWREKLRQRVLAALPGMTVPAIDSQTGRTQSENEQPGSTESGKDGYGTPSGGFAHTWDSSGPTCSGGFIKYAAPGADFIPALLFGDKYLMDSGQSELLARSTLAHSLALSGLHLSYAAALGYLSARLLFYLFPALAARIPRRRAEAIIALLPALAYTWLGGAPPSLLRALLMLAFWALLLFLRKPSILLDGLLWAVALILLLDPGALFDLRLQMSALAVAAIALAMPLIASLCRTAGKRLAPLPSSQDKSIAKPLKNAAQCGQKNAKPAEIFGNYAIKLPKISDSGQKTSSRSVRLAAWPRRIAAKLAQSAILILGTSLAVQIFLMPLLVHSFGLYGLAFPLNLLWLPVLGLFVMPAAFAGLAASALNLPDLAGLCFQAAVWPCAKLMEILNFLDGTGLLPAALPTRPHWLFMIGWWMLLLLLPVLIRFALNKKRGRKNIASSRRWSAGIDNAPAHSGASGVAASCPVSGPIKTLVNYSASKANFPISRPAVKTAIPLFFAALALLLCLAPNFIRLYETGQKTLRLRLLDVGQGQAILLEWPGGGRLLLDGGGGNSPRFDVGRAVIAPALLNNRPPKLDYMLASHPDQDHIQGLLFPLEHLDVGFFADNGSPDIRAQDSGRNHKNLSFTRLLGLLEQRGLDRNGLYAGDVLVLVPAQGFIAIGAKANSSPDRTDRTDGPSGSDWQLVRTGARPDSEPSTAHGSKSDSESGAEHGPELILEILHPPRGWAERSAPLQGHANVAGGASGPDTAKTSDTSGGRGEPGSPGRLDLPGGLDRLGKPDRPESSNKLGESNQKGEQGLSVKPGGLGAMGDTAGAEDGKHGKNFSSMPVFTDNNASLVARLVWKGQPLALLCGDAEREAQRHMLETLPPEALRAQVLVLPHHGSAGASLEEFYRAVNPQLALASCGYGNQWNFPSRLVRERLQNRGIPLLSTADSGQIILEWRDDGFKGKGAENTPTMRVYQTRE